MDTYCALEYLETGFDAGGNALDKCVHIYQ